jgi:hypothetical protein
MSMPHSEMPMSGGDLYRSTEEMADHTTGQRSPIA